MSIKSKDIHKRLFSKGYFPKELPCNFEISNVDSLIDRPPAGLGHEKGKSSAAIAHNLTRFNNFTRKLAVPHPIMYFRLTEEIATNFDSIVDIKKKSPYCLSFPVEDDEEFSRAYSWENDWQTWKEIKIKKQVGFKHCLRTDISNFYPSVYTHVIPWVIEGKGTAKKNKNDKSLLGNCLDAKIRNCQDGQTQGLQIGPDTSFLISEMILNHIDGLILKELNLKKNRASRRSFR